jgi:hypothetical protein
VSVGLEEQVVCHDCRPGPPTEQLAPVQAEELSHAPTELLNPIHIEEHLAGPRTAESQPGEQFAEPDPAPIDGPPAADPLPDPGLTEVLPLEMSPAEMSPAEMSSSQLLADEDEPVTAVAARTEMFDARADPPRTETRRAKAAANAAAGAPHRRALRRRPGVPARGTLKDDVQGPLVILAVLCAVVAIVGGFNRNSFLGLTGGLLSGAAVVAIIIIGLTSPKK